MGDYPLVKLVGDRLNEAGKHLLTHTDGENHDLPPLYPAYGHFESIGQLRNPEEGDCQSSGTSYDDVANEESIQTDYIRVLNPIHTVLRYNPRFSDVWGR